MNKEELYKLCKKQGNVYCKEKIFSKNFPEFYKEISEIGFPKNFKFSQKLYHYFNNDYKLELGICLICGKRCHYLNINEGYRNYCSLSCRSKDENLKEKQRNTCLLKYGKDNIFKTEKFKKELIEKNQEKYKCNQYVQSYDFKNKSKKTCLEKYGVEYASQSDDFKNKSKKTCLEKYGVEYALQNEEIQKKKIDTCIKKYGEKYPSKNIYIKEKAKQTCMNRYNAEYVLQLEEVKNKSRKTCLEKYGVEYYAQTSEFHKNKRHKFYSEITNESFDSTWELKFAEYCFNKKINYIYQPDIHIEYIFDNKIHYYQPDFKIGDKIYEIKGTHFFENSNPNKKMINPFNRNKYTDDKAEAKHQCMIEHNVIIITDINNLKDIL